MADNGKFWSFLVKFDEIIWFGKIENLGALFEFCELIKLGLLRKVFVLKIR
jgi:hypothetical protein